MGKKKTKKVMPASTRPDISTPQTRPDLSGIQTEKVVLGDQKYVVVKKPSNPEALSKYLSDMYARNYELVNQFLYEPGTVLVTLKKIS